MNSPERTLGHIRTKIAQGHPGMVIVPYQPPAIVEMVKRIERALRARC